MKLNTVVQAYRSPMGYPWVTHGFIVPVHGLSHWSVGRSPVAIYCVDSVDQP